MLRWKWNEGTVRGPAVQGDEARVGDDLDVAARGGRLHVRDAVPAEDHQRQVGAGLGLHLELLELLYEGTRHISS